MGDKTDHGGTVISATSATVVMGKVAALRGDSTVCPKCKGKFPITATSNDDTHAGRGYAYDGDTTACGARLITSLQLYIGTGSG